MTTTNQFSIHIEGTAGRFVSDTDDVGSLASWVCYHLEQIAGAKITAARVSFGPTGGVELDFRSNATGDPRQTYDSTYNK